MPLVAAKCTSCGGKLNVDSSKDAAICPYCGVAYVVEKAINNYNTIAITSVVSIYSEKADFEIRAGSLIKYNGVSKNVVIPDGVERITGTAFADCEMLESIVIPDGVKKVDEFAFSACKSIKYLEIPGTITELERTFWAMESLETVVLKEGIKSIGEYTFAHCGKLKSISFPNSLTIIGREAFFKSGIEEIMIPDTIDSIGLNAFSGCDKLRKLYLPASIKKQNTPLFLRENDEGDYIIYIMLRKLKDVYIAGEKVQVCAQNRDLIKNILAGSYLHERLRDLFEIYREEHRCAWCGGSIKHKLFTGDICSKCGAYRHDYSVGLPYNLGKEYYNKIRPTFTDEELGY